MSNFLKILILLLITSCSPSKSVNVKAVSETKHTFKSVDNYKESQYTNCCASGPCEQFYKYKIGNWKYYYSNGNIKATVQYDTKVFNMDTSCEGGADLKFGKINLTKSKFYNKKGIEIKPTNDLIFEFETVEYDFDQFQKTILTLQNEKIILNIAAND